MHPDHAGPGNRRRSTPSPPRSGKCAGVKAKRYVLTTTDGSDYFEVACSDGKGYMLQVDHTGKLADTIACAEAFQIGGGCTLTDARQALTQQNALYSDLAKKAGFDCAVIEIRPVSRADPRKDIVEMACSNRPDGGVGIFPAHGPRRSMTACARRTRATSAAIRAGSALFPRLDAELKAKNKGGCVVSSARPFAHGDDGSDFVEVGLRRRRAGLGAGLSGRSVASPSELRNCVEVANLAGGCQLPTNRKKT